MLYKSDPSVKVSGFLSRYKSRTNYIPKNYNTTNFSIQVNFLNLATPNCRHFIGTMRIWNNKQLNIKVISTQIHLAYQQKRDCTPNCKFIVQTFTYWLFLSLLLFPLTGRLQDYTINIQHFGVEDGLLHRDVSTIFEDKDGFIWVGGIKGIQRFDGHEFKSWTKVDHSNQIYHITAIGQDQDGWLWLWNNSLYTFVFLHPITEEIQTVEERFGDNFPIQRIGTHEGWHHSPAQLSTDDQGRLYFISSNPNQLISFDTTNSFQILPLTNITDGFLKLYLIDDNNHLWLTKYQEKPTICQIDTQGNLLQEHPYPHNNELGGFSQKDNNFYYESNTGSTRSFYKIDMNGKQSLIKEIKRVAKCTQYHLSLSWEYTNEGWNIYDHIYEDPVIFLPLKDLPQSFDDIRSQLFEDSKGRVWLPSAWGLGLAIIKPNLFQSYFSFSTDEAKPFSNSGRGILVEHDYLFVNFEFGGLVKIPKKSPDNWSTLSIYNNSSLYFGRPIIRSTKGGLYTGGVDPPIKYIQPEQEKTTSFTLQKKEDELLSDSWSFYEDENNILWVGMTGGLAYLEPGATYLKSIDTEPSFFTAQVTILHIIPATEGKLWICAQNGLHLFDTSSKRFLAHYHEDAQPPYYLPATVYHYLYIDQEGIHWLATDQGLIRWDKTKNESRLFTTIDGLSNDVVYAIFEDDYNQLWLSSDFGIMQFDKTSYYVNAYLEEDGITHNEFNKTSAFKEKDGTIYFGGLNGVTAFHPKDFRSITDSLQSKMLITSFEIYDGATSQLLNKTGELRTCNTITFEADDRFFRLKFALPSFEDIKNISYAWKIEGLDQDWNYQKESVLQIGKLPYGTHILRIKGQHSDGKWSPNELSIKVLVIKPFYLQYWFLILIGLLVIGSVILFYQIRTRLYRENQKQLQAEVQKATSQIQQDKQIITEQAKELRQLDKVKSKFFANVSHELRTPLTLILGPISSVLKSDDLSNRNFTRLKKAQQSGKALLKLIAAILDLSKLESGKIELQEQPVQVFSFIRRIVSTFESYAQQQGILFSFSFQAEQRLQLLVDKDKLEVILNNLLSNAMKFTSTNGKINVQVEDLAHSLVITVTDTGQGIHPDDLPHVFDRFYQSKQADAPTEGGTGIGLALSQEFAKIMSAQLSVESTLGKGSVFKLSLPRNEVLGSSQIEKTHEEETIHLPPTAATAAARSPQNDDQLVPPHRPTLLVVEDNYSLREYITSILQEHYQVATAENGKKALVYLNHQPQDQSPCQLILSDIMMPEMDGYQLLAALKANDQFRHLPVIMLTARADMQDKLKALRIGVDDYLLKPFEEEELLVRIANLLQNQQERISEQPAIVDATTTMLVSQEDKQWLETFEEYLQQHLADDTLSVPFLAQTFAMSESSLLRQLKRLTGLSPKKYLQEARLTEARCLLENRTYSSVAQVAAKVGFSDTKTFSRSFKNRFGKLPSGI